MKSIKYILIFLSLITLKAQAHINDKLGINLPLEERKLNSGHKIWMSNNSDTELVTICFIFKKTGSYFEPKEKAGLSEFFVSMLNEGVRGYSKEEIARFKERYGVSIISEVEPAQLVISITTPSQNIKEVMTFLNAYMNFPTFKSDNFAKVQDRLINEYKSLLNYSNYYTKTKALDKFFANTPLTNIPNAKTINNISRRDLQNYLQNNITSQNIIISVAGDISEDLLNKYLPDLINSLPKKFIERELNSIELTAGKNVFFENNTQFGNGVIRFYSKSLPNDLDFKVQLMVLNEIFGGSRFTARLMNNLRTKKGFVYGAYSSQIYNPYHHILTSNIEINFDNLEEGLGIIKQIILNLNENGVSEKEIISAKNSLIAEMALSVETDKSTAMLLADLQNYYTDIVEIIKLPEKIASVTKYQLDNLCKEWFKLNNFYFYLLGDAAKTQRVID